MAVLHVKTPNGTTQTIDVNTMNIRDSLGSLSGYTILPNGLLLQFGHYLLPDIAVSGNTGIIKWTLPLSFWGSRTTFACTVTTKQHMIVILSYDASNTYVQFVVFDNGVLVNSFTSVNFYASFLVIDRASKYQ